MFPMSALCGNNIDAMNSQSNKPEPLSSVSPLAKTLEEQLLMIQESENQPGQIPWGTAELFHKRLKMPKFYKRH